MPFPRDHDTKATINSMCKRMILESQDVKQAFADDECWKPLNTGLISFGSSNFVDWVPGVALRGTSNEAPASSCARRPQAPTWNHPNLELLSLPRATAKRADG